MPGDQPHTPPVPPRSPEGPAPEPSRTADQIAARLLGAPRTMRRRDISAAAQVSGRTTRQFWHALGFANVRDEDTVFTEADLAALQAMVGLVRRGVLTTDEALAMTRALGRTTDRLAVWQTQLVAEVIAQHAPTTSRAPQEGEAGPGQQWDLNALDPGVAREAAHQLAEIADALEPMLVYAWRRHLGAAVSRLIADAEPEEARHGVVRTVGFADLVSFTELVRRSTERNLARLVQRFEALSSDVISQHGGRVIKTVGDEVLYQAKDPVVAVRTAVELVRAIEADDLLPDIRVGMATGRVLLRLGDIYGTTVNRASRLTAQARAGTILVDSPLAAELEGTTFRTVPLEPRVLQGLGEITPHELQFDAGHGRVDPGGVGHRSTDDQPDHGGVPA